MVLGKSPALFFGGANQDAMVFGDGTANQEGFFFFELPEGIYFDGIHIEDPQPFWEDKSPITNTTDLLSGEASVQSSKPEFERPIKIAFKCRSPIHHTITRLQSKKGKLCTLMIHEYEYKNCMITKIRELEWCNGLFSFIIWFAQDTTQ